VDEENDMTTAPALPLRRLSSAVAPRATPGRLIAAVDGGLDDGGLSAFSRVRPRLYGIAYRMLGSVAEAEDMVQDVWVRWQTTDRSVVRDVPAFLAKTTTRLAINVLRSARSRLGTHAGVGFREPADAGADPGSGAERGEALRLALLTLQERLRPMERAVYLLREAFDYSYRKIADVLGLEEANARQHAARARQRIADGRRAAVVSCDQGRLLGAFMAASQGGDLAALEALLASDVASIADRRRLARAARP
jgi:RNA polymerase sigma factor (sigma-70 family)